MYELCHRSLNFIDVILQTGMIDFQKHYLNISGGIAGTGRKPNTPNIFGVYLISPIYLINRRPDFCSPAYKIVIFKALLIFHHHLYVIDSLLKKKSCFFRRYF